MPVSVDSVDSVSPQVEPKWTDDAFLDRLRASTDDEANAALAALQLERITAEETAHVFAVLSDFSSPVPDDAPRPMLEFFDATRAIRNEMVQGLDVDRLQRGTEVFRTYAAQACITMLASSLPSGYSAPCLANILTISEQLNRHPYRRLLGVLQLLVNISQPLDDDLDNSSSLVTAQKLRLLHAGVRSVVGRKLPDYEAQFGSPVNHEDMLATIMGFSWLVADGWRILGVGLSAEEIDDYWYCWRQFARLMGIFPDGQPLSEEFVPQSMDEAATFYSSYVRRHFEHDPRRNPEGVRLTQTNLEMMMDLIPGWMRWLGFGAAPRIAMETLLGREGLHRVGMQPITGHGLMRSLLNGVLTLVLRGGRRYPDFVGSLGQIILQGMIRDEMGGRVTFLVPMDVDDMKELSRPDGEAVTQKALGQLLKGIVDHEGSNLTSVRTFGAAAPLPFEAGSLDSRTFDTPSPTED